MKTPMTFDVGTMLKYKAPVTTNEESAIFEVVEDNGDRGFMRLVCDLPLAPTCLYNTADMIEVTQCI